MSEDQWKRVEWVLVHQHQDQAGSTPPEHPGDRLSRARPTGAVELVDARR
ncbi:hypothetical protein [Kribbella sindirgiensis]|nr:hypothetical protein [Kribbella sindirgiensis]